MDPRVSSHSSELLRNEMEGLLETICGAHMPRINAMTIKACPIPIGWRRGLRSRCRSADKNRGTT
jgi:hypothetical protein